MVDLNLRPYESEDQPGIISLIDGVLKEYGQSVDLARADADLLGITEAYDARGGAFIVLEDHTGHVCGTHATLPLDQETGLLTFRRLYLAPEYRGCGQGGKLMSWALNWGRANGFHQVHFWSDTLFTRAHAFFTACGFEKTGEVRTKHDSHDPYQEFGFSKIL